MWMQLSCHVVLSQHNVAERNVMQQYNVTIRNVWTMYLFVSKDGCIIWSIFPLNPVDQIVAGWFFGPLRGWKAHGVYGFHRWGYRNSWMVYEENPLKWFWNGWFVKPSYGCLRQQVSILVPALVLHRVMRATVSSRLTGREWLGLRLTVAMTMSCRIMSWYRAFLSFFSRRFLKKWGIVVTMAFNTKMVYFLDDLGLPHFRKPPRLHGSKYQ